MGTRDREEDIALWARPIEVWPPRPVALPRGQALSDASRVVIGFERRLKAAGLPRRRIHDVRNTFASALINEGEDIKLAQELLGHASIAQTAGTYAHVSQERIAGPWRS